MSLDATSPRLTAAQFREHFPGLRNSTHLAACSRGPLSDVLADALAAFQNTLTDSDDPWPQWLSRVEQAREGFAALIGAKPDEIAITSCASEGAFQAASGLEWSTGRDSIITTDAEFPSIAHVWLAQRGRGARVRHAPAVDELAILDSYAHLIDHTARLVSVPLVSYRNGQRLPVGEISNLARKRGAQVFVDAYQAVGVEPVDVRTLDCDYLVCGAQKYLLGIPGIAFLYVRDGTPRDRTPELTGWFARADPFDFDPRSLDFATSARRYQTGTPPAAAAYGAAAGLELLTAADPTEVAAHVASLILHLQDVLQTQGEQLASPQRPRWRGPQVALHDAHPERLAAYLAARHIATSPRGQLLRLAVHYYNNHADLDTVAAAISDYRGRV